MGSASMILAAFAGSMISMGFVLVIARRVRQMSVLVVCGVMISYICSAITDFVVTFADDANIVNLHNWSMGSFSGTTWDQVRVMAAVVLPVSVLSFCMAKPISAYQLGEEYARSLGVNAKRFRAELILLSSVLSACVTAFAGTGILCGHRCAAAGKAALWNGKAHCSAPRLLPGRRSLLPAQ